MKLIDYNLIYSETSGKDIKPIAFAVFYRKSDWLYVVLVSSYLVVTVGPSVRVRLCVLRASSPPHVHEKTDEYNGFSAKRAVKTDNTMLLYWFLRHMTRIFE